MHTYIVARNNYSFEYAWKKKIMRRLKKPRIENESNERLLSEESNERLLSEELWIYIFQHLKLCDLVKHVPLVCRLWNRLSNDYIIGKIFYPKLMKDQNWKDKHKKVLLKHPEISMFRRQIGEMMSIQTFCNTLTQFLDNSSLESMVIDVERFNHPGNSDTIFIDRLSNRLENILGTVDKVILIMEFDQPPLKKVQHTIRTYNSRSYYDWCDEQISWLCENNLTLSDRIVLVHLSSSITEGHRSLRKILKYLKIE